VTNVENADGTGKHPVGDVVFEAFKVSAPNTRRNFWAAVRKAANLQFPRFVFVKESVSQLCFCIQISRGGDQFSLRQAVEGCLHRTANRAFRRTSDEGTPSSPSTSICKARNELTVASSICSSREWISALANRVTEPARPGRLRLDLAAIAEGMVPR